MEGYVERIFLSMRDDNGPEPHVSEPPAVAATRNPKIRFAQFLSNPVSVLICLPAVRFAGLDAIERFQRKKTRGTTTSVQWL